MYVKWKGYVIHLTVRLMSYFPLHSHSKNKIEVELDLSNYATKSNLKNVTVVDVSQFAKKMS